MVHDLVSRRSAIPGPTPALSRDAEPAAVRLGLDPRGTQSEPQAGGGELSRRLRTTSARPPASRRVRPTTRVKTGWRRRLMLVGFVPEIGRRLRA